MLNNNVLQIISVFVTFIKLSTIVKTYHFEVRVIKHIQLTNLTHEN